MADSIQDKLMKEVEKMRAAERDYKKSIGIREQLGGQLNENQIVLDELNLLKNEAEVYKSVGPILIKTDLVEAKQNVSKRMDFINKEIKRVDEQIHGFGEKQAQIQQGLMNLKKQFDEAQLKAAIKA